MALPSIHSEGGGRKFVATISAGKAGGKSRISLEPGAHVRAGLDFAKKLIDRSRSKFMKRDGEAT
jgi:hypothetical protein